MSPRDLFKYAAAQNEAIGRLSSRVSSETSWCTAWGAFRNAIWGRGLESSPHLIVTIEPSSDDRLTPEGIRPKVTVLTGYFQDEELTDGDQEILTDEDQDMSADKDQEMWGDLFPVFHHSVRTAELFVVDRC